MTSKIKGCFQILLDMLPDMLLGTIALLMEHIPLNHILLRGIPHLAIHLKVDTHHLATLLQVDTHRLDILLQQDTHHQLILLRVRILLLMVVTLQLVILVRQLIIILVRLLTLPNDFDIC